MNAQTKKASGPPPERRATEFLANERTFLAWVRTGIAVLSLGFLVSRFSLWIRELKGPAAPVPFSHPSVPAGEAMMAFGALLTVLAAWRYHVVNRQIERGEVSADRWLIVLVTVLVVALTAAMIAAIAVTSRR
jgi:putative membrane protein